MPHPGGLEREKVYLAVYQITRSSSGGTILEPQPGARISFNIDQESTGTWKQIDVKRIVQRWLHHPAQENLGLYVIARRKDGQNFVILNPENEEDKEKVSVFFLIFISIEDPLFKNSMLLTCSIVHDTILNEARFSI